MAQKGRVKPPAGAAAAHRSRRSVSPGALDISPRVVAQLARQRAMFGAVLATPAAGVIQREVILGKESSYAYPRTYASSYAPDICYKSREEAEAADKRLAAAAESQAESASASTSTADAAPASGAGSSAPPTAPPLRSRAPQRASPPPAPLRALTPSERGYPLGFGSMKEFRDATRPVAVANRHRSIIVRGSSVTGKSGDGSRDFRGADYPNPPRKKPAGFDKADYRSDIDVGVVGADVRRDRDINRRGFPRPKTAAARLERRHQRAVRDAIGFQTGLKFFAEAPDGAQIERPHTPDGRRTPMGQDAFSAELSERLARLAAERDAGDGADKDADD